MDLPLQGHQSYLFLVTFHFRVTLGSVSPFLLVFYFLYDYEVSIRIRILEYSLGMLCVQSENITSFCDAKMFSRMVYNNDEKKMPLR